MLLQNLFFEVFFYRKLRCMIFIFIGFGNWVYWLFFGGLVVFLLKKLFFQFDNLVKDNKNWYVMVFCLLFIVKKIFQEVMVGFLIVGYIYEDIDVYFSYFFKFQKMKNIYVFVDLMKVFMDF